MARRSLKPQLNQIRAWVRQGRTDAWIAHQLEVSASELREFRSQHDLNADEEDTGSGEIDLRDEIEAEIEAAAAEEEEEVEEEDFDDEEDSEEEARKTSPRERPRRRPRESAGRRATRARVRRARRRERRRWPSETQTAPGTARRPRAQTPRVRSDFRPRRARRLRPLARPLGQGQPGLRPALGGQERGHGQDRSRPDSDPPPRRACARCAPSPKKTQTGSRRPPAKSEAPRR